MGVVEVVVRGDVVGPGDVLTAHKYEKSKSIIKSQ
jgi:hypothetical protein